MTVYYKTNAIGVDAAINAIIEHLDDELNTFRGWNVDIYHRIYKEKKTTDKGIKTFPFSFKSSIDYEHVFNNDKVSGEIGFVIGDNRNIKSGNNVVNLSVIFSLNILKILGNNSIREDEKLIIEGRQALAIYYPNTLKTGIKNVYSEFDTDNILYADMQPFVNFSYDIKLIYLENCTI
jgi:hypothetical protein